ncbi:cell wall synthase accessory phosphoprotein MacP [Enterococcus sp. DIV0660C]|uniref:cell wall synthase accessory phosphoprotein MacP n=1 Tax=Enterococcus sp. DIV0660C TaxID=2230880 RepID=UPI001A8FDADC|nr:cell wall synthase accessory phosphoprotein MacP [Enterococcus sp. DIV0660C]MBO0432527.1 cell wall synthase accessory phosphoprotein MacP [Enterococcus sp. DIV0660C]
MAKGPLITRSELRKRQKERMREPVDEANYQISNQSEPEPANSSNFYRKVSKNKQKTTKTRTSEREKTHKWNVFLMKALGIVILLLCVVILAIIFI